MHLVVNVPLHGSLVNQPRRAQSVLALSAKSIFRDEAATPIQIISRQERARSASMLDFGVWQGRLSAVIRLHHQHRSGDRRERSLIQHRCTSFPNAARLTFSATGICSEKPSQLYPYGVFGIPGNGYTDNSVVGGVPGGLPSSLSGNGNP